MVTTPLVRLRPIALYVPLLVLAALLGTAAASAEQTVLLPWVTPTRGALVQSSDLYLLNPGSAPMLATFVFRRRGVPETNPPRATRTVNPGATLYVGNVMKLFQTKNVAGAVVITVDGDVAPVVTSFNNTFTRRNRFLDHLMARSAGDLAEAGELQYLVGLQQDATFTTSLFLFNPSAVPATLEVDCVGLNGSELGSPLDVQLAPGLGTQIEPGPQQLGSHTGGFTVLLRVRKGQLLSSAQVVNRTTGEPAYVPGVTR